ncbi:class I SAM-dependent methyltransferase [Streptomyces sp. KM273126]|uniref:class I SAM-dependent methyltransferase n=1 Tax=Streptomyces sp. KM273126 TaxID=2545247 RepID=UPI0014047477|nr:class I SAM-dependent methyltransferase [Streptomyces sp. KM273126]MBA2811565.1 class I SAM-dependent methyltransferase [Streptomyces sp. KM273126]
MRTVVAVDEWDAHYAAGRDFRPVTSEEGVAFDLNVGPGEGRSALDIGCGTGGFASFLCERGYSVVGVDYAGAAISTATTRHQSAAGLSFRHWNAEADPWTEFPARDLISCRLSYAFIQEKSEFLRKVKSSISPGGVFYVMTPHSDKLPPERNGIGVSADEIEELRHGWTSVKEWTLDAQHVCYALTL